MTIWLRLIVCISLLLSCSSINADSLWDSGGVSPYTLPSKRIRVGDMITVYISESTSAAQSASTRTEKEASLAANMTNNWDQVASLLGNESIRKQFDFSELNYY